LLRCQRPSVPERRRAILVGALAYAPRLWPSAAGGAFEHCDAVDAGYHRLAVQGEGLARSFAVVATIRAVFRSGVPGRTAGAKQISRLERDTSRAVGPAKCDCALASVKHDLTGTSTDTPAKASAVPTKSPDTGIAWQMSRTTATGIKLKPPTLRLVGSNVIQPAPGTQSSAQACVERRFLSALSFGRFRSTLLAPSRPKKTPLAAG
jgi:hypothetical protein